MARPENWSPARTHEAIRQWTVTYGQPPVPEDWKSHRPGTERNRRFISGDYPYATTITAKSDLSFDEIVFEALTGRAFDRPEGFDKKPGGERRAIIRSAYAADLRRLLAAEGSTPETRASPDQPAVLRLSSEPEAASQELRQLEEGDDDPYDDDADVRSSRPGGPPHATDPDDFSW